MMWLPHYCSNLGNKKKHLLIFAFKDGYSWQTILYIKNADFKTGDKTIKLAMYVNVGILLLL